MTTPNKNSRCSILTDSLSSNFQWILPHFDIMGTSDYNTTHEKMEHHHSVSCWSLAILVVLASTFLIHVFDTVWCIAGS